jgi:2-haloacid dehalogenase
LPGKVGKGTGKEALAGVWLVSGNPFDVVGARAVGLQATWVDRAGGHHGMGGWNDRSRELVGEGGEVGPTVVVKGADEAVKAIQKWTEEHGAGGGEGEREGMGGWMQLWGQVEWGVGLGWIGYENTDVVIFHS